MNKVLLVGYSGHRNFGDDLLLSQAYTYLKGISEISIWTDIIGEESGYLDSWFPSATIIRSKTLGINTFKKVDKVLYFGGGVFFDYKKKYPKALFLKKTLSIIRNYYLSRVYGVRFAGIGIGLGPFNSTESSFLTRFQLRAFDFIGVRDQVSYNLLVDYGLKEKAIRGFDLSFFLNHNTILTSQKKVSNILICPRKFSHHSKGELYHNPLIQWALEKKQEGTNILVYGFQSNHDEEVLLKYKENGLDTMIWNPDLESVNSVLELFGNKDLIVSARMHGIYIAGIVGCRSLGINVHPKVDDATSLFENSKSLPVSFTLNEIDIALKNLILNTGDKNQLRKYRKSAQHQYEMVKTWLISNNI
jgi:polysaccharide pyruvyl transferase WcaK-like protein